MVQPQQQQQQTPQNSLRMPLFSVSSLVNMPSSPAPKSLDFMGTSSSHQSPSITANAITPGKGSSSGGGGPVSLPPTASAASSVHQAILEAGGTVMVMESPSTSSGHTAHKEIFSACKMGDLNKLKRYLTPANVNIRDTSGGRSTVSTFARCFSRGFQCPLHTLFQPLHFASGFGRLVVVEYLLANGANIHAKDDGGLGTV